MDFCETALLAWLGPQHPQDVGIDLVGRQRLGALIGEAVQRRLSGEPVAAGVLVEIGRAFMQFLLRKDWLCCGKGALLRLL